MSTPYAAFVEGMKDPRIPPRYAAEPAGERITVNADGTERREPLYIVRCADGRQITSPTPEAEARRLADSLNRPGA